MAGATANYNPDGTLNIEYYRSATLDIIEREAERRGYTADNLPPTYLNAALRECYHSLFDPRDGSAYGEGVNQLTSNTTRRTSKRYLIYILR